MVSKCFKDELVEYRYGGLEALDLAKNVESRMHLHILHMFLLGCSFSAEILKDNFWCQDTLEISVTLPAFFPDLSSF